MYVDNPIRARAHVTKVRSVSQPHRLDSIARKQERKKKKRKNRRKKKKKKEERAKRLSLYFSFNRSYYHMDSLNQWT